MYIHAQCLEPRINMLTLLHRHIINIIQYGLYHWKKVSCVAVWHLGTSVVQRGRSKQIDRDLRADHWLTLKFDRISLIGQLVDMATCTWCNWDDPWRTCTWSIHNITVSLVNLLVKRYRYDAEVQDSTTPRATWVSCFRNLNSCQLEWSQSKIHIPNSYLMLKKRVRNDHVFYVPSCFMLQTF